MLDILTNKEFVVFSTRDYAGYAEISVPAASKQLSRLAEKKTLVRFSKGLWANVNHPYFSPLACTPYLLNKEQGYVSFLTALHLHGVLSQIPKTIQIATTGHTRILDSSLGYFEFFKIKPELMRHGVSWSETRLPYQLATAEKALIDVIYIATRRNRRFSRLPELTLAPGVFNRREFKRLFEQLPLSTRLLNAMARQAEALGAM